VQKMLDQHSNAKVRVFAVWEPILPTDWSAPTTSALGRLSDRRVAQFWDKEHTVAKLMAASRNPEAKPDCCNRRGILWDLIAVYPAGAVWDEKLLPVRLFNGPVVRTVGGWTVF
jgi:hypothetical protein